MSAREPKLFQVNCQAGIRRDGTRLDSGFYVDGEWVRFCRGRPRKIGGMKMASNAMTGPIRALSMNLRSGTNFIHSFNKAGLERCQIDNVGIITGITNRTPVGFVADSNWLWQNDVIIDVSGGSNATLVAHANKEGTSDAETDYPVYYGSLNAGTALTSAGYSVSGGVVVLHPYTFSYGNNGLIQNSIAGNPAVMTGGEANIANVAGTKILKGLPVRGTGQSPAGLFWARDSLIRVGFIGGTALWKYDQLSVAISLMSPQAVLEYDGIYYWMGIDRFYFYAGQIQELPNDMNLNYLFDNINWSYAHRVWAMKIPRWGEIWWFFPSGSSQECDRAVIYNVREKCWYDAMHSMSAGVSSPIYRFPLMADTVQSAVNYRIWAHEMGTDKVEGAVTSAIQSYFETADFGYVTGGATAPDQSPVGEDKWTRVVRVEPDFVQTGEMSVVVRGSNYANGPVIDSAAFTFDPTVTKVDLHEQRREVTLKFESNTVGGFYEMGKVLLTLDRGDVRG